MAGNLEEGWGSRTRISSALNPHMQQPWLENEDVQQRLWLVYRTPHDSKCTVPP